MATYINQDEINRKSTSKQNSKLIKQLVNKGYVILDQFIGSVGREFANDPRDLGSIPGRVIPKTLKEVVLDTSLLNT